MHTEASQGRALKLIYTDVCVHVCVFASVCLRGREVIKSL